MERQTHTYAHTSLPGLSEIGERIPGREGGFLGEGATMMTAFQLSDSSFSEDDDKKQKEQGHTKPEKKYLG